MEHLVPRFVPCFFDVALDYVISWPERPHPLVLAWNYHLWFLVMLLWFAFLAVPIFLFLRSDQGKRLTSLLAERSSWRGSSLLFGIPIALAHVALRASFPDEHDWGELAYYLAFFIVGYVLVSDARFLAAVRRDLVPALAVGVVGFSILVAMDPIAWVERFEADPSYTSSYFVAIGLLSFQGWAWAVAAISVAMRVARFQRPLPEASADAAMPFFLLHQPVILALAYFVVAWNVGVPLKLLALLVTSFTVTAAAAWALSRPAITRTMLGVKARRAMRPAESGSFVRYPDRGRGLR